jgi:hypothetical protein
MQNTSNKVPNKLNRIPILASQDDTVVVCTSRGDRLLGASWHVEQTASSLLFLNVMSREVGKMGKGDGDSRVYE